ncbi:FAD-dependent oxidoreductase [Citricoccus sp. GCM10030269]|uniref:FAD-dependent oxidoreductase n=1 Tax=Citricoccus sp. GCM10030269 TaxID=3273388 RepID=UPI003617DA15
MTTTVAVIGAGSVGAAAGLALARDGAEVTLFDLDQPPHGLGAHAGESRLVRSLPYLEKSPGEAHMLRVALDAWDRLEQETGTRLITRCGGLAIGHRDSSALQMMFRAGGDDAEYLDFPEVTARFPQFAVGTDDVGVMDRRGGIIDPAAAVSALLDEAVKAGARTRFNTAVSALEPDEGGVVVRHSSGTDRFDKAVLAAGTMSAHIEPHLHIRSRRILLGWFRPKVDDNHLLADCPSFIWSPGPGEFLYGAPSYSGQTFKFGMEHDWGTVGDPVSEGRQTTPADVEPMREAVATYLPWLEREGERFEMHIDAWAHDNTGLLGERADRPGIILATGWSGYGFKIAPAIGLAVSDLVLGRDPRFDISALQPDRDAAG